MTTRQKNIILFPLNVLYAISPEAALKVLFFLKNGYSLDLKKPITYNQKLQWIKLNYKNPLLPKLVDKYTVREHVEQKCPEILNELLWQGYDSADIPWESLPDKFVIKVTHGSGFNIICTDKAKLDRAACQKKLNQWIRETFLKCYGEWFYGVVKPSIIIERFLDDGSGQAPIDFKILCFDGEPKYITVHTDRLTQHKTNVYDVEWNIREGYTTGLPNDVPMKKPEKLDALLNYARILSEGFPHVRVDLYIIGDEIYFGEMTFTQGAGFDRIRPYSFDVELGSYFKLPE